MAAKKEFEMKMTDLGLPVKLWWLVQRELILPEV